ncbi:uncharacterized protein EV422DRAFT_97191 [Fimicolochytrium jonesii]|uniref:uncharacterized protein n=1 Tax=Fimicolochytrium jonesii TaxID=1396493 RepID=UPI0022FE4A5B|nr:uncharacterized protein EV422DRAFT_97191 [Fimicolochytrium jonesii]KAI8819561.1 hypothetical protein EV422DRAFT_97191 [Fimicolochytrium jonesii]
MPRPKAPPKPKAKQFDYSLPYATLNLRKTPNLYTIGKGEQGVFVCEPYRSELSPLWRFKTPDIATTSSQQLYAKFLAYKAADDFVGMDMARKFIQMGVTRARRYANHKGGRKYVKTGDGEKTELPRDEVEDPVKAESARIFGVVLKDVREDEDYVRMAVRHKELYENSTSTSEDVKEETPGPSASLSDDGGAISGAKRKSKSQLAGAKRKRRAS